MIAKIQQLDTREKNYLFEDSIMFVSLGIGVLFNFAPLNEILQSLGLFLIFTVIFWAGIINNTWPEKKKKLWHLSFQIIATLPMLAHYFK